ncbi:hypothetical protein M422DRAFT_74499 [Sphaerobolus stellatus SS14]|nr:hypothetical protein M422DRAFT_74499 [Sphaerobolus stellatus SS14]
MARNKGPKPTPFSYLLIRWLFRAVLKVFYGTIVIENEEYLPKPGEACIVCANHVNSLTDAILLMTASKDFLRMTAKSTQFGRKSFTSWLIENSGALPLQRKMDVAEGVHIDNSGVMDKLYKALEDGDAICLFPEGMSRYRPSMMPLKTGVARIISEVLTRKRDDPNYEITLLTCSITYMNRQHFRSDVLLSFNPPIKFTPQECQNLIAPVDFSNIKKLTNFMATQISAGTLDSPSWDVIRTAKTAAKIYAPLGTKMTLGDYVRVVRVFIEGFKKTGKGWTQTRERSLSWDQPDKPILEETGLQDESPGPTISSRDRRKQAEEIDKLAKDLETYQKELVKLGIKDERIKAGPLSRYSILLRLFTRTTWLVVLLMLSCPGLILWSPVFAMTIWSSSRLKKSGPQDDVWDEIAQHKLLVGLFTGCCVWFATVLFTFPIGFLTFFLVPAAMWMSLRFLEDAIADFRAANGLTTLLRIGPAGVIELAKVREGLYNRVRALAVNTLSLPADPEKYFKERGGREKGRVRGPWESGTKYFSIKRRRKRDWDEILRIWPHDE